MSLSRKRLFLLDMDGTLYIGDRLFPAAAPFLSQVRALGGRYVFMTNNSSRSVDAYIEKLDRLGIASAREDYLTSVDALIVHLQKGRYQDKLLYAFGTATFRQQLCQAGFSVTDRLEDGIAALVTGFDTELTFQKLEDACILLNRGVDFIATNPDWVCPTWYGFVPDCGSVCQMLTKATGREPVFIGKPKPDMVYLAMEAAGAGPEETLLVGDRLYTDIACGVNAGIETALVLSGETSLEQARASDIHPTYIFDDIGTLSAALLAAQ